MTVVSQDNRPSLLRFVALYLKERRQRRAEHRALDGIAGKPDPRWLEDAGLTREDAARLGERRRLHSIAEWSRWHGRGL